MAAAEAAVMAPMPRATQSFSAGDSDDEDDNVFSSSGPTNMEIKKPVIFTDADVTDAFSQIQKGLKGIVPPEDDEMLDEIFEYATTTDDALVTISKAHFTFLSDILASEELKTPLKVNTTRLLQVILQRSNAINVLRFCPEHPIMEYLILLGRQKAADPAEVLEALKMLCNACATPSGFSWLNDECEWTLEGEPTVKLMNIWVVSEFYAFALTKFTQDVHKAAVALAYNLSIPEIPEGPAGIITQALLKFIAHPSHWVEDLVGNAVNALLNFAELDSKILENVRASGIDWLTMQARCPKAKDAVSLLLQKLR